MDTVEKNVILVYAEGTPNPASMKFVTNQLLVKNGRIYEYLSLAETIDAPLAAKLFDFPFVKTVFITNNFVTVSKKDSLPWGIITEELSDFIRTYINTGNPIINELPKTEIRLENSAELLKEVFPDSSNHSIGIKIREILEQYVQPAVENDGGSILFKSFDDGIVTVQLRGSCSGCPSASFTLKAGIEGLLKQLVPEVKEVVAETM